MYTIFQETLLRVDILTTEVIELNLQIASLKSQISETIVEVSVKSEKEKISFFHTALARDIFFYVAIALGIICTIIGLYYGFSSIYSHLNENFLFKSLSVVNTKLLSLMQESKAQDPSLIFSEMEDSLSGCIIRLVFEENGSFKPGVYIKRLEGTFQLLSEFLKDNQCGIVTDYSENILILTQKTADSMQNFYSLGL